MLAGWTPPVDLAGHLPSVRAFRPECWPFSLLPRPLQASQLTAANTGSSTGTLQVLDDDDTPGLGRMWGVTNLSRQPRQWDVCDAVTEVL